MRSENILQSNLLDIVFENRNKDYGAYELRKHYKRRLVKALLASFIMAGGIVAIVSFAKDEKIVSKFYSVNDHEIAILREVEIKKPAEPKKPAVPKAPAASKPVAQQKFVANMVITKDPALATKINTLQENIAIGGKELTGEPKGQVFVPDPIKIDAEGTEVAAAPEVDKLTPRLAADVMPAYPGGMPALKKFLEKNLQSFDDIEDGKVVAVKITFVVGYDGKLKGFKVLEDGGTPYNNEVIRVLKKMPEWIPGKANGENVSVYYTIPVKFTAAQ